MSQADICFSFSPEACLRKWFFLREEKKLSHPPTPLQKVLVGLRNEMTPHPIHKYTSNFSAVEGGLKARNTPLILYLEGVRAGR